jgi:hypothetical protein
LIFGYDRIGVNAYLVIVLNENARE